jgi:hypothetical protein
MPHSGDLPLVVDSGAQNWPCWSYARLHRRTKQCLSIG